MPTKVILKELLDQMDMQNEMTEVYLNTVTGEYSMISEEDRSLAEADSYVHRLPEWEQERLAEIREVLGSREWRRIPRKREINELEVMRNFANELKDKESGKELKAAIEGSNAFEDFRQALRHREMTERWYGFRAQVFRKLAVQWLEENNIDYSA